MNLRHFKAAILDIWISDFDANKSHGNKISVSIFTCVRFAALAGSTRSECCEAAIFLRMETAETDVKLASAPPPDAAALPPASAAAPPSPSAWTERHIELIRRNISATKKNLLSSFQIRSLTRGSSTGPSGCPEPVSGCSAPALWQKCQAARKL